MNQENQEVSNVIKALRKKLEDYREKRPNLSIRAIAKHSHVNRYFLNKILTEDDSTVNSLDFSQVLLLAKFLTSSESLKDTIDNSSEEIRNLLLKAFDADYECDFSQNQTYDARLEEHLEDFENFIIILLASMKGGIKRSVIERSIIGKMHYKIDKLIKCNFLSEENGIVTALGGKEPRFSAKILTKHIPSVIRRFYSIDNVGNGKSYMGIYYQNINEETFFELRKLHKEFVVKVNKLIDDQNSKGDIPVFTTICVDSFI